MRELKKKRGYKYTIQNEKEIIIAITEMKSKTINNYMYAHKLDNLYDLNF